MLKLDKKDLQAVEAMLTVASHNGVQPISCKEIAAMHDLSPRYLEQMLQHLVRGDLLRGVRGPRGGYVLAREKRRISIADILEVTSTANDDDEISTESKKLRFLLEDIHADINEKLRSINLQQLIPTREKVKRTSDFAI